MAKKKKQKARTAPKKPAAKRAPAGPTFSFTFSIVYNKLAGSYKVQMCVTGGRWIGQTARAFGKVLKSRILTSGAAAALATVLTRMAS